MIASRSRSSRRRGVIRAAGQAAFVAGLLAAAACKPGATAGDTVTPGVGDTPNEGADPLGRDEGDNVGDLQARLQRLRADHERVSSQDGAGFGKCEDLCELASSICSVKESLCEIADEHPGDASYQGLCREAQHECREANDSCVRCVERSGSGSGTGTGTALD